MGYRVTDALRSIQVLPGDLVNDVEMVTIATTPTGMTATYAMQLAVYTSGEGVTVLNQIADGLENLVTNHHAVAGVATQQIDNAGFIADMVDVTVAYVQPNGLGTLTGVVSVPVDFFALDYSIQNLLGNEPGGGATPADLCDAEYARLQQLAGG